MTATKPESNNVWTAISLPSSCRMPARMPVILNILNKNQKNITFDFKDVWISIRAQFLNLIFCTFASFLAPQHLGFSSAFYELWFYFLKFCFCSEIFPKFPKSPKLPILRFSSHSSLMLSIVINLFLSFMRIND